MKQIKTLDEVLLDGKGVAVIDSEAGRDVLMRDAIEMALGVYQAKTADQARKVWKLCRRVMDDAWSGELEDAEHELLIAIMESNPTGLPGFAQGQILERLEAE